VPLNDAMDSDLESADDMVEKNDVESFTSRFGAILSRHIRSQQLND